jgi:hypothetical protein
MATNRRTAKIEGTDSDFYPTPTWGTKALLHYEGFKGTVDEICCGEGDMSKVLINAGYKVRSSDLHNRGYGEVKDFLKSNRRRKNICTNPPFNIANEIVTHALKLTKRKACFLLRTAFLESITRYEKIFRVNPPTRVYTFTERLSMYPKGSEVKGGGTTSYSWFIWDLENESKETRMFWIQPGFKPKKSSKTVVIRKNKNVLL